MWRNTRLDMMRTFIDYRSVEDTERAYKIWLANRLYKPSLIIDPLRILKGTNRTRCTGKRATFIDYRSVEDTER